MVDRVSRYAYVTPMELFAERLLQTSVRIPLTVPAWYVFIHFVYLVDQHDFFLD